MLWSGCKKKEAAEACFTVSSKAVIVGKADTFTNCSIDASTYYWDFGDTTVLEIKNPVKIYNYKGTFKVQLAVNNGSLQRTTYQNILVGDPYVAKIVISKVPLPADTAKILQLKLHIAPYQGSSVDTTISGPLSLPLSVPITNIVIPMTPGRNLAITVTAVTSAISKQSEADVVPGIQPNSAHGTDQNGTLVLDVFRKVM